MLELLTSNQFATGGLLMVVASGILFYLKSLPEKLWDHFKRIFSIEANITDRDPSFNWIDTYLSSLKTSRKIFVFTKENQDGTWKIFKSFGVGLHFLFFKGRLVVLQRERKDSEMGNTYREEFIIRIFSRNLEIIDMFLEESKNVYIKPNRDYINVKEYSQNWWKHQTIIPKRSLDTIIINNRLKEDILNDLNNFMTSESRYNELGIPYRRGYLLYGPPGNGKTSFVIALASHFDYDISYLQLSTLSDSSIINAIADLSKKSFVLIEDIDRAVEDLSNSKLAKNNDSVTNKNSELTLSGLLNVIDGVVAGHRRILFITTNNPDKIPDVLKRPGRVDRKLAFPTPDYNQINQYLEFLNIKDYSIDNLLGKSMSEIQEILLLQNKDYN